MIKLKEVHIEHFKVLKDFELELTDKAILLLKGDNGVGKSSLMQFIQIALGQTSNLPPNSDGKGLVVATKNGDQYVFSVEIKDGKTKVIIEGPDGLKDNRKGVLAQIVGAIDFDPNEFVELSKTKAGQKKQVEIYRYFLPQELKDGLLRMETNYKVAFDERTEMNRQISVLDGAIKKNPIYPFAYADQLDQFKPVDVTAALEKQKAAQKHNELYEKAITKQETNNKDVARLDGEIKKKEDEIAKLKKELEDMGTTRMVAQQAKTKTDEWVIANPKIDTSEFDSTIKNASEANKKYEQAQQIKKDMAELAKISEESGHATANIESQREAIRVFVRKETPVDGLEFDEENLIYKGRPVHPSSMATSEIIELGIRMKMAENPELGILFIEHGESLGKEKFQALLDISENYGYQLLIEQVERGTDTLKIELISDKTK